MGFGHDLKSGDYKVVRFALYRCFGVNMEAEVYSLRTDSWRPVAKAVLGDSPSTTSGGVCLGGFCYWIGHLPMIISFDMSNEVFRQFHLPEQARLSPPSTGYMRSKLFVWKGSLALVMFPFHAHRDNVRSVHVWSLEVVGDGPLTVKEHRDLYLNLGTIRDVDDRGPLGMDVELLCNDDLIIKLSNQAPATRFKAYHISSGQIRNISLVRSYSFDTRMVSYTPSFVSLFP